MKSEGVLSRLRRSKDFPSLLLLTAVIAVVFLPAAMALTYYRDDWYYMLDGYTAGPRVFLEMFRIDRPARGLLFSWLFSTFGPLPHPYNLVSLGLRLGAAVAAFWVFSMLWPGKRSAPVWGSLLFALYPGYLWWVAGIEYLPMMLSLLLQVVSIGSTLAAIRSSTFRSRLFYWVLSVLTGWGYLALVEYAIGIEVFRLLCVWLVVGQEGRNGSVRARILATVRDWAPALLVPLGFLVWRLLVFENLRADTDLAYQVGVLIDQPLLTTLRWGVRLIRSWTNLVFFAWGVPVSEYLYGLRLADLGASFLAAAAVGGLVGLHRVWSIRRYPQRVSEAPRSEILAWVDSLGIGVLGALAVSVPIVVANRFITFEAYSHYALPGSLPAVVVLVGLLQILGSRTVAVGVLAGLLAVATLTHRAVATIALTEQRETAQFWWQVLWRAPGFQPGTTFFASFPSFSYADDASVVWGPANLIYGWEPHQEIPVLYSYSAVAFPDSSLEAITSGEDRGRGSYRTHSVPIDFGKLVVAVQTLPGACVRLIDGRSPLLSPDDPVEFRIAAPYSRIAQVDLEGPGGKIPEWLFGHEPDRGWCYYFEKAELALQQGEIGLVPRLAQEASQRGLKPLVGMEWIPFARAYVLLGMQADLELTASRINADPANRRLACQALLEDAPPEYRPTESMRTIIDDLFCY